MTFSLRRPSEARRWLLAWVIFSVLGGLWALSSPLFSVPDEPSHAVYAAAAVRGDLFGPTKGNWTEVTVPADFADAGRMPTCYFFHPEKPAGCAPMYGGKTGTAKTGTSAGRYPPAYYLYAGLGSLVLTGGKAIYLMRLLTVILCAAMLASAACSMLDTRRPKLALVGLGFAVTPMVLYFTGAVNPQGPEIAAAVAAWACGYVLLTQLRNDPDTPLTLRNRHLRRTLVALVVLSLARPLSLLWLAILVVTLLAVLATRPVFRRLLTSRTVLCAIPVLALSGGSTVAWVLLRHTLSGEPITAYAHTSLAGAALISSGKAFSELEQMIGVFGWLDTSSPALVYVAFLVALGALGLLTLLLGNRRLAIVLGLLTAAVVAIPVFGELMTYKTEAFPWQGRYTLPIAVGVPLLLALSAATSGKELSLPVRRVTAAFAAVFVAINVVPFVGALNRYISGVNGFFLFSTRSWRPPFPAELLIVAMFAALVLTAVVVSRVRPVATDRNAGTIPAGRPLEASTPDAAAVVDAEAEAGDREPVPAGV